MSSGLIARGAMPPGSEKTDKAERQAFIDAYRKSICDELMAIFDPTPYIDWLQPISDQAKAKLDQTDKEVKRRIKEDEIHRFGGEQK